MYFDVHYDYTTSLRHPWYMSSFVFFRNKKKRNMKKNQKKKKRLTLFKSVTPIELCAHSICTVDAVITWQVADQGSKGPTGSQIISLHIYVQLRSITVKHCHDVWLFHLPQPCRKIYIQSRFHDTPVCLCISNVALFTLPCYVTTPCTGCQLKYWSYQKGDIFKY